MDWKDIPSEFRFLLEEIQKTCPEAIIAGGAMRDWFHGHTPKSLERYKRFTAKYPYPLMIPHTLQLP